MFLNHKNFFHRSKLYNLSTRRLEDNITCDFLDHYHFQRRKQKVYLVLENLDQLDNLNICFEFDLLF